MPRDKNAVDKFKPRWTDDKRKSLEKTASWHPAAVSVRKSQIAQIEKSLNFNAKPVNTLGLDFANAGNYIIQAKGLYSVIEKIVKCFFLAWSHE